MTSACDLEEEACYRGVTVFSHMFNSNPWIEMKHEGCVLQRLSLDALSDVMVVLELRQSIT